MLGDYRLVTGSVGFARMEVFEGHQFRVLTNLSHGDLEGHLGFTGLEGSSLTRNSECLGGGADPDRISRSIDQFPGQVVGFTSF